MRGAQSCNLVLEVGERLEAPVHRGEPQVCDLIEVPERAEDGKANLMRGNLAAAPAPDRVLYLLREQRQLIFADGPALACAPNTADDLVPVERLGDAASLGNGQDHRLLSGEAATTGGTRPPTADRGAIITGPAVDDAAVRMPGVRAIHAITSPGGLEVCSGKAQAIGKLHACNYYILWSGRAGNASRPCRRQNLLVDDAPAAAESDANSFHAPACRGEVAAQAPTGADNPQRPGQPDKSDNRTTTSGVSAAPTAAGRR